MKQREDKMIQWVSASDGFIAANVMRWKEGVFKPRRSQKGKPLRIGEQLVTDEVLREPDLKGYIHLIVRGCEIVSELAGRTLLPILTGTEMNRSKKPSCGEIRNGCCGPMKAPARWLPARF